MTFQEQELWISATNKSGSMNDECIHCAEGLMVGCSWEAILTGQEASVLL